MNKYLEKVAMRAAVREMMAKTMNTVMPKAELDMVKSVRKSQSNLAINKVKAAPSKIDSTINSRKPGFFTRTQDMRRRAAAKSGLGV